MDLNLEQAFEEPVDLSHRFEIPSDRLEREELLALGPVSFEGRLQRADSGFVLDGNLRFGGTVACARCLAPVDFSKDGPASWMFVPAHERPKPGGPKPAKDPEDLELLAGDLDVIYYDELTIPFDPLIEEEVQLELPMKALCREDCKGICPTCGADRNTTPCSCVEAVDGRWKALAALLPRN
jgi:uncharacterized protein